MRIILDAFGGDHAPLEAIKGGRRAADKLEGVEIILAGQGTAIQACAKEAKISLKGLEILEAPGVFETHYEPVSIVKECADTSMAVGLKALAEGKADAFVSAGSTGALMVGATLIVKRIRGVRRGAIGTLLPTAGTPVLLLDAGANAGANIGNTNAHCTAEMLTHFAVLGTVYMQAVRGIKNPRVGLVNIGTEENKGDTLRRDTYQLLSANKSIHFVGNIEAREIPLGGCDVAVTDGFTGNIILKLCEGMGKMLTKKFMEVFTGNPLGILGLPFALPGLLRLKKEMDYKEHGGAPILGIGGVVVKAHGSSDAKAFYYAVRQAKLCVDGQVIGKMKAHLNALKGDVAL